MPLSLHEVPNKGQKAVEMRPAGRDLHQRYVRKMAKPPGQLCGNCEGYA